MFKKLILYLMLITSYSINSMHDFTLSEIKEEEEKISQDNNFANNRNIYNNSAVEKALLPYLGNRDLTNIVCDYLNNFNDWKITEYIDLFKWESRFENSLLEKARVSCFKQIDYLPNNRLVVSRGSQVFIYDLGTKKLLNIINDHYCFISYQLLSNNILAVASAIGNIFIVDTDNGQVIQYGESIAEHIIRIEGLMNGNLIAYCEKYSVEEAEYKHEIRIFDTSTIQQYIASKKPLPLKCLDILSTNEDLWKFKKHENVIFSIDSKDSKNQLIIYSIKRNTSIIIELKEAAEWQNLRAVFCFLNNNSFIANIRNDKNTTEIHNLKSGELIGNIEIPKEFKFISICKYQEHKIAVLYKEFRSGKIKLAVISNPLFEKEKIKKESLKNKIINFFKKSKK